MYLSLDVPTGVGLVILQHVSGLSIYLSIYKGQPSVLYYANTIFEGIYLTI
jgi:hypothetical protein